MVSRSRERTLERFEQHNRLSWGKFKRNRLFTTTPVGQDVVAIFLEPLAQYLGGADVALSPGNLGDAVRQLDAPTLALAGLTPILDNIERGWPDRSISVVARLALQTGQLLLDRLELGKAIASDDPTQSLVGEIVVADPKSLKGQRIRGKLKKRMNSKDPEERAAAERALARPRSGRGRRSKSDYMDFLRPKWNEEQKALAGGWLVNAVLLDTNLFTLDDLGYPIVNPEFQPLIDRVRAEHRWRNPVLMPHTELPPAWTGWRTCYEKDLSKTLVRDWRPETKVEIEAALAQRDATFTTDEEELRLATEFAVCDDPELKAALDASRREHVPRIEAIATPGPFVTQHVAAVDNLRRIRLRVDPRMLDLVERFGGQGKVDPDATVAKLLSSSEKADIWAGRKLRWVHRQKGKIVDADVRDGRWVLEQKCPVRLSYSLDRRGRVYANQQLNFGREDHVRALFKFERGLPLGNDGVSWLEIHCANCFGEKDKAPWGERIMWAKENKERILAIAANPAATFAQWREAENPFAFVASCLELAGALANPAHFVTHLPVSFDGSCNALQHLALMMRDEKVAKLANLSNKPPQDVYGAVIQCAIKKIKVDGRKHARWWASLFDTLRKLEKKKTLRDLLKTPVMAFAYGISDSGMSADIGDVFREEISRAREGRPPSGATLFLAKVLREACEEVLSGPAEAMRYIRAMTAHCANEGRFLQVVGPTGMPFVNRYHLANIKKVHLANSQHDIADGVTDKLDFAKLVDSAPANLTHMMDAAHLVRVVNAAAREDIEVIPVHDSHSCLAPQALRLNHIIRSQLALMYSAYDPLAVLRASNVEGDILPLPPRGNFDPLEVQHADYCFA